MIWVATRHSPRIDNIRDKNRHRTSVDFVSTVTRESTVALLYQPSRIDAVADNITVMLWLKSFHIIFVVTWFAGLFYLPRLFVYHALADDAVGIARFKAMERKLFWGIMTPSAALALLFGAWLWLGYGFGGGWLTVKLPLVALVVAYHGWCYSKLRDFRLDRNRRSHIYYRWWNEAPVVLLAAIVILTVVKPG